jgi:hypothetical protein
MSCERSVYPTVNPNPCLVTNPWQYPLTALATQSCSLLHCIYLRYKKNCQLTSGKSIKNNLSFFYSKQHEHPTTGMWAFSLPGTKLALMVLTNKKEWNYSQCSVLPSTLNEIIAAAYLLDLLQFILYTWFWEHKLCLFCRRYSFLNLSSCISQFTIINMLTHLCFLIAISLRAATVLNILGRHIQYPQKHNLWNEVMAWWTTELLSGFSY